MSGSQSADDVVPVAGGDAPATRGAAAAVTAHLYAIDAFDVPSLVLFLPPA